MYGKTNESSVGEKKAEENKSMGKLLYMEPRNIRHMERIWDLLHLLFKR